MRLRERLYLSHHVYARLEDGTHVRPTFDPCRVARMSWVHYMKFAVGGRVPVAIGIDLPPIAAETPRTLEQRHALAADLTPDR